MAMAAITAAMISEPAGRLDWRGRFANQRILPAGLLLSGTLPHPKRGFRWVGLAIHLDGGDWVG
jgi:hypothetical protein